jgi:hypothetical protein
VGIGKDRSQWRAAPPFNPPFLKSLEARYMIRHLTT